MGRRQLAGKDMKIAQGQRRDAFFAKMRRKGGVPRLPSDGLITEASEAAQVAVEEPRVAIVEEPATS